MITRTAIHPLKILAAVGVAFVLWGLVLAYDSSPAWAAPIPVNTTDDELNADGDCSLREAIQAANADAAVDACATGSGADTIALPSGTYPVSSQQLVVTSTVTVDGGGATSTFIDGGNAVRLFFVASGAQLSLNELTLTKGHIGSNDGGAIRNEGTLVVTNSAFSANTSNNQGGGIFSTGTLVVSDSTFSGNTANLDGGAISSEGILEVTNSTFSGNTSTSFKGGAISNRSCCAPSNSATVSNSTFSGNSAASGGAIANERLLAVTNSTFSGNSAFGSGAGAGGGGIWNHSEITLTVTNSTFSGNSAAAGGGIFNDSGTVTPKNTIVANSPSGGNCSGTIIDVGGNLEWPDDTCGFATPSADPMLGPLADNGGPTQTHALGAGSAAIDAAVDCPPPATDQRGVRRPQGSACDIGAFELDQPPTVTINQASGQADPTTSSPIRFTVVFNEPVSGFTDSDVTLSGTAGATTAVVTEIAPNAGTTYDVAVSGMTTDGTVIASIPANAAKDIALNGNTASTSTDNTVTFIVNRPPTAVADNYSTNEDTPLSVAAESGVLGNDTDPDSGDTLKAVLLSAPTDAASFTLNENGSFSYTPASNFKGKDSFTYKANDGRADSNFATVTITVNSVNDAPSFQLPASPDQTVNMNAGAQSVSPWATNISAGPSDESDQEVSFEATNNNNALFSVQPSVASNGTLTYTPAPNASGSATVSVTLKDNGGTTNGGKDTSATQTFTINVTAPTKVLCKKGGWSNFGFPDQGTCITFVNENRPARR